MGRIQSDRVTADTNIVEILNSTFSNRNNPCVFNGVVISAIDSELPTGAPGPSTISIYSDNTGSGTTNLVFRTEFQHNPAASIHTPTTVYNFTNGIYCKSGLRVELSDNTNIEVFVLHS